MIVRAITRFANRETRLASKVLAAAVAALLAMSFLNVTLLPGVALADEAAAAAEPQVQPVPEEAAEGADVYVYLQLEGAALEAAKAAGLTLNGNGWFTVGTVTMAGIPQPNTVVYGTQIPVSEVQGQIADALKSIDYFPGAEVLSLSAAQWTSLKIAAGATDYEVAGKAWHLDGVLSDQLVGFEVHYVDAEGNELEVGDANDQGDKTATRTILAALGSQVAASDQAIDIEGYEYSEKLTAAKNGGLLVDVQGTPLARTSESGMTLVYEKKVEQPTTPDNPGDNGNNGDNGSDPADKPATPGDNGTGSNNGTGTGSGSGTANGGSTPPAASDNKTPSVPSVKVPTPQASQQPQGDAKDNGSAAKAADGFKNGERTTVSEPAPQAATAAEPTAAVFADEPAVEAVAISDDATPMVTRAAGAEAIAEEEVPLGAFDAPVDPAPWVAGMGAIGTALWGVVAVRRRLVMAQKLATFEGQVLGNAAAEASTDAVAIPNAGHQVL